MHSQALPQERLGGLDHLNSHTNFKTLNKTHNRSLPLELGRRLTACASMRTRAQIPSTHRKGQQCVPTIPVLKRQRQEDASLPGQLVSQQRAPPSVRLTGAGGLAKIWLSCLSVYRASRGCRVRSDSSTHVNKSKIPSTPIAPAERDRGGRNVGACWLPALLKEHELQVK